MKGTKSPLVMMISLFLIGLVLAFIAWRLMAMKDNLLTVVLIFAPNIFYWVYTGLVGSVKIRDIELVFGQTANKPINLDENFPRIAPTLDDIHQVGDQGIALLEQMLATYELSEDHPIVMIMRLGDKYTRKETLGFIEKLSSYRSFKFVIFLDPNNHVVAYMPGWAIRQELSDSDSGKKLLDIVAEPGRIVELKKARNVYENTLRIGCKYIEALELMEELSFSAAILVNDAEEFQGVIDRERLVSQMMLNLMGK